MSNTFLLYDSSTQAPKDLLNAILGNIAGINIVPGSINYVGLDAATSIFSSFNFGGPVKMDKSGILLTSGTGTPSLINDSYSYTQYNQTDGDAQFDLLAQNAFNYAGKTQDAAILEFSFIVTDPSIKSISFDIVFGSEEFPTYIDSSYVDIAAVLVNGVNYGLFDGDPKKPLSIIGNSVNSGSFLDNGTGYSTNGYSNSYLETIYSIQYNGISPLMTVQVPLDGSSIYNVRLGVADTGDAALDSGLFISNFTANTSGAGGLLVKVEADPAGGILMPAGEDTATLFIGGQGNDTMNGSTAADIYNIQAGGNNTIQGTLDQLNNDTVLGFDNGDTLSFINSFFSPENLTVTMGSAILDIDVDGDGKSDARIVLEGDYANAEFFVSQTEKGSEITVLNTPATTPLQQQTKLAELYVGFFGRAAEHDGMQYHTQTLKNLLASGMSENEAFSHISNGFWEAAKAYGDITGFTENTSNFNFIATVYSNVLGRPDAIKNDVAGIDFWKNKMESTGQSHGEMVLDILNGAHAYIASNPNDTVSKYVDTLLDNRTDISLFFAQAHISGGLTGNDAIQTGWDVINRIDHTPSSVTKVKAALTNGTLLDLPEIELVGASGIDTFAEGFGA